MRDVLQWILAQIDGFKASISRERISVDYLNFIIRQIEV